MKWLTRLFGAGSVSFMCAAALFLAAGGSTCAQEMPDYMVRVGGSIFRMGDTFGDGNSNERPVHAAAVSAFYVSRHEVTQREWLDVMGTSPSHFTLDDFSVELRWNDLPVEQVSWLQAVEYCNKLSVKKGFQPCYTINGSEVDCDFSKNGFRLPTEAEWEYAAKGGLLSVGYKYAGGNTLADVGWYRVNAKGTTNPLEQKKPNELDLFDMSGDVFEWCWDRYGLYPSSPVYEPRGAVKGSYRIMRGGSWGNDERECRVTYRAWGAPDSWGTNIGFRVAARMP